LFQITGVQIGQWLNVEFPEVQQTRVDLLGAATTDARHLVEVELQSANSGRTACMMPSQTSTCCM
jgi:hypothetical protein